jgi:hypothetical protein
LGEVGIIGSAINKVHPDNELGIIAPGIKAQLILINISTIGPDGTGLIISDHFLLYEIGTGRRRSRINQLDIHEIPTNCCNGACRVGGGGVGCLGYVGCGRCDCCLDYCAVW